jgi:hypothetical protein
MTHCLTRQTAKTWKKTLQKMMAGTVLIWKTTTNSRRHEDSLSAQRCERCGHIQPAIHVPSRAEILLSVICGVGMLAILAPALYFGGKLALDHFRDFPSNPPWHEPLDDWSLQ